MTNLSQSAWDLSNFTTENPVFKELPEPRAMQDSWCPPEGHTPVKGNSPQALHTLHLGRRGMNYAQPSLIPCHVHQGLKIGVSSLLDWKIEKSQKYVVRQRADKRDCLVYKPIHKTTKPAKLTYDDRNQISGFLGRWGMGRKGRLMNGAPENLPA